MIDSVTGPIISKQKPASVTIPVSLYLNEYANALKQALTSLIREMSAAPETYVKNPETAGLRRKHRNHFRFRSAENTILPSAVEFFFVSCGSA